MTLINALELPEQLKIKLIKTDIILFAATENQTVYRLNTTAFISVPDMRLLEMYIGMKRFCAKYAKQKEFGSAEEQLSLMIEQYHTKFMDEMRMYI